MKKDKKDWKGWLATSTKLVGFDPVSFEERWSAKYSRLQLFSIVFLSLIIVFFLSYLLLSYTFVTAMLPSSVRDKSRREVIKVHQQMQKLDEQVTRQEFFISNLQNVILGKIEIDSVFYAGDLKSDDIFIDTTKSKAEKLLETTVMTRKAEQFKAQSQLSSELFLLEPVVGKVSQKFKPEEGHFGVDIVTKENEPILACMKGVVVYSGFTEEDGWVLVLNHPNEIVTVYKHCVKIIRSVGDQIRPGDPIAIVGNTGLNTTGTHLHFELWSANGPVNPLKYLSFK